MNSALPSPRVVLFDLDDTLFDHRGAVKGALQRLRREHPGLARTAFAVQVGRYLDLVNELHEGVLLGTLSASAAREDRFRRLLADAGSSALPAEVAQMASVYREEYQRSRRPVTGAPELLGSYHEAGIPVGIVTNNLRIEQEEKLEAIGLAPLVDLLLTSEEAGYAKPSAEIFRLALRRLRAAPPEARMVGDSFESDVVGARSAGIPALWFNPRALAPPAGGHVVELGSLHPAGKARRQIAEATGVFPAAPDTR
ncbi:MAG: HAD family hydrolase [Thermoplasmata archaeon]|nr:HAD family hydrolase [Thermoplasmata archaeon]